MALFDLPEKLKAREVVQTLDDELSQLKAHVESRNRVLEDLDELLTGTRNADAQRLEAQKEIYALMHEKLRGAELAAIDDFVAYVDTTIEGLEKKGKKGAK